MIKISVFVVILSNLSYKLVTAEPKGDCAGHYDPPVNNTVLCQTIFDMFHRCTSKFLEKSLERANPFTLCTDEKAHYDYQKHSELLNILQTCRDIKTNISCSEMYFNKNSMSVISHIVATSKSIWETAYCDDCYADSSYNVNQNFSDHTIRFRIAHEKYTNCTNDKNATLICKECLEYYQSLNQLFDHERSKRGGKICFDLEDIMNKTRLEWSVVYKCCRNKNDSLTAFYSLFSSIMVLTVLFYVTVYAVNSNSVDTTLLDAREIEVHHADIPTTSSGSSSTSSDLKPKSEGEGANKKMSVNDDSDDEPNILNGSASQNTNLIALDN